MVDRYFAKVMSVVDKYTIVMNKGENSGISVGDKFIVVGIGGDMIDPDTKENLGKLEIVRGKVVVTHIQEKISTLKSYEYFRGPDIKEIKTVNSSNRMGIASFFAPPETTTESIVPRDYTLMALSGASKGDLLIKI